MGWVPPSTLEERLKRALIPQRWELARIVRRELKKGEPELRLVPFLAPAGMLALDIGANRGIWTHVLSRHGVKTLALEPNPKMFQVLNSALPAGAEARMIAASDASGTAELEVPGHGDRFSNQHASLNPARNSGRSVGKVEVQTARLDDMGLPPVGFIKIDVEGHEKAVLDGARELVKRDRPRMIVELEERHTQIPIRKSVSDIEALGYDAFILKAGTLRRIEEFDPARDHNGVEDTPAYINNFIFLPR